MLRALGKEATSPRFGPEAFRCWQEQLIEVLAWKSGGWFCHWPSCSSWRDRNRIADGWRHRWLIQWSHTRTLCTWIGELSICQPWPCTASGEPHVGTSIQWTGVVSQEDPCVDTLGTENVAANQGHLWILEYFQTNAAEEGILEQFTVQTLSLFDAHSSQFNFDPVNN